MIPLIIVALCFHELSHGWVAYLLGDPTAKNQGRLTLNPLKHLDPIGTLMMIFARFGWAKPVPVNPLYFKGNRQRGMLLVALAGPLSNIILAFVAGGIVAIIQALIVKTGNISDLTGQILNIVIYFLIINISLASFNLIPLPPLDGSKVLASFLPRALAAKFYEYERYAVIILLVLVFTGGLSKVLLTMIRFVAQIVTVPLGIQELCSYFGL